MYMVILTIKFDQSRFKVFTDLAEQGNLLPPLCESNIGSAAARWKLRKTIIGRFFPEGV
jgi:hypothetical protein